MPQKLAENFFHRDALEVAPDLLGKLLVRKFRNGRIKKYRITDVEAYRGEEDRACHARRGRTAANEILYEEGGKIYVYLIYGMYWLLNLVTGPKGMPQGVMIRAVEGIYGPGRVGRELELDKSLKGGTISGNELWLEDDGRMSAHIVAPRVGIEYAKEWKDVPWRFIAKPTAPTSETCK